MKKSTKVIRGKDDVISVILDIVQIPQDGSQKVTIEENVADRSLAQNRLSHMHYAQIGNQTHETPAQVKARCKLEYGIPILIQAHEDFARGWGAIAAHLSYEEQTEAVKLIDVTSVMSKKEFTAYIEEYMMIHESQGIVLNHPSDLFWQALGYQE